MVTKTVSINAENAELLWNYISDKPIHIRYMSFKEKNIKQQYIVFDITCEDAEMFTALCLTIECSIVR